MHTTYRDINTDRVERREYQRTATVSVFGRSYCYITCPFCRCDVKAFIWSLSGGGKRCSGCGALHCAGGLTYKLKTKQGNENGAG